MVDDQVTEENVVQDVEVVTSSEIVAEPVFEQQYPAAIPEKEQESIVVTSAISAAELTFWELVDAGLDKETATKMGFELCQGLKYFIKHEKKIHVLKGFILKTIKDHKLYRSYGEGGYSTWKSFLADPEIDMKLGTANMYIRNYEFYIEELKLPKEDIALIPINRLNTMKAKLATLDRQQQLDFIAKAATLSHTDLDKEMVEHKLKAAPKFTVRQCGTCEKLQIEYDVDEMCHCNGYLNVKPMEKGEKIS